MKKYLIAGFFLFLFGTAFADSIYKWTDENGKVHYGDRNDGKRNSTQIIIKAPEIPPNKTGITSAEANKSFPENKSNSANIETPQLQKCLAMARVMVDKKNSTPSEIRADSKNLLDICPGTAYECVTFIERPEGNNCKAVPMQPNGNITKNSAYKR